MPERDPRTDPKPGDVLHKGGWEREVTGIGNIRGYQIRYVRRYLKTGRSEDRHCDTHEGWWRWSKGAEIVRRGE